MRKRKCFLLTGIMLTTVLLVGCGGKSAENAGQEKQSAVINENQTMQLPENQTSVQPPETAKVLENENVYDGINRIAVTFCGDTSTQIGLSWYTPYHEDLKYGNDVEVLKKSSLEVQDVKYEVLVGEAEYDENSMYHQTVVKGLLPATEYYFRVGDAEANQWSAYGSFRTSSAELKEFQFVALTDTQAEHLPDAYFAADTMERAVQMVEKPAFIMHSGDFVDEGDEETLWLSQMNAAKETLLNHVIVPAVGNHEVENHSFWQHFALEHTNDHKTTGVYYSYDYGNVHFVVLDTNKVNEDGTSYIDDEQLEWLEEDLKQAKEKNARWMIVNMHKGLYTIGEHADNEMFAGEEGARMRVGAVFEKYGVDLVIQGHDHCPSVTYPLKGGVVSEDGIIYINTGSAGAKTYEPEEGMLSEEYLGLFEYKALDERENDIYQNFAVIDVTEERLQVTMYEVNQLLTQNNTYILKTFSIDK